MAFDPLLAGIYDPRGTLSAEAARARVERSLAHYAAATVQQWGPLTVGLAPSDNGALGTAGPVACVFEGNPRLGETWANQQALADAWRRDGDDALARFRGSFTMLLWNADTEHGAVVRDQIG